MHDLGSNYVNEATGMPVFSPGDLERLPEWVLLYLDGRTLRQVADEIGVSHQTVSNHLTDLGITARYRAAYQEYRLAVEVVEHAPAIRTLFLSLRTTAEIAEDLGVSEAVVVASLDDEWPDWRILDSTRKQTPKRYSSDELRQCLLDAAAPTTGVLSTTSYDSFVAANPDLDGHRPRPGKQAMMLRFGGWNAALRNAGLPTNPKSGPSRRFDDPVAMLMLLVRCWDDIGKPPTVDDYGRWQKGKPEAPSPATARRLLRSWPEARIQAWQLRHGVSLDPNSAVAVPPELLGGSIEPGSDTTDSEDTVPTHAEYRRANENTVLGSSTEWVVYSAEQRERALTGHARLQNALADEVGSRGLVPLSPSSSGPQFDLGFVVNDVMVVIEVKSCTLENVEIQSRLGLGQVLRYAHRLRAVHDHVIGVLATELPLSRDWLDLLAGLDVHLLHEKQTPAGLDALLKAVGTHTR